MVFVVESKPWITHEAFLFQLPPLDHKIFQRSRRYFLQSTKIPPPPKKPPLYGILYKKLICVFEMVCGKFQRCDSNVFTITTNKTMNSLTSQHDYKELVICRWSRAPWPLTLDPSERKRNWLAFHLMTLWPQSLGGDRHWLQSWLLSQLNTLLKMKITHTRHKQTTLVSLKLTALEFIDFRKRGFSYTLI